MSGIKDSDNLDSLRNRLYQRGTSGVGDIHHDLTDEAKPLPTDWNMTPAEMEAQGVPIQDAVPEAYGSTIAALPTMKPHKRRGYRLKLALLGVAFFGIAMIVSSFFMVFGRNSISGDNISIALTVPFTVAGGEVVQIQVGITNDNTVPMESATLVIEYPPGTKSDEETPRDLYTDRIPLDTIDPGETINMPLRARVFGEENEEKSIKASVEYRVEGSSARLFKNAEPKSFKISSAPVSFRVDGVRQISSGQETSLTLTVVSNSLVPLPEVLVKAEYPSGFEFKRANPQPSDGQNAWLLKDVTPQSSHTITISGIVHGEDSGKHVMKFSAGIPSERSKSEFASVFANAETTLAIEAAFINIGVKVAGLEDRIVTSKPGQSVPGIITIKNTLKDNVYDLRVVVTPSGTGFQNGVLSAQGGFYDSTAKTLTWDVSHRPSFDRLEPGASEQLNFTVKPSRSTLTDPSVNVKISVFARRVSESNVAEELLGSVERTIRVSSEPVLSSSLNHGKQIFIDSGPVPPMTGEDTTYTVSYRLENGTNNINNGRVTTRLPLYVSWLNKKTGDGQFEYNQTSRVLTWAPGTVSANAVATASFQVSVLPSTSQIGSTPVVISEQSFSATDGFTGDTVETTSKELTTSLPSEAGFDRLDGVVVEAGADN